LPLPASDVSRAATQIRQAKPEDDGLTGVQPGDPGTWKRPTPKWRC